jgi:hypothetical protein
MSTVTLTLTDNPNDPNVVDIKWDVTDDEGTGAANALAAHLIDYLGSIKDPSTFAAKSDVEPKE